MLHGPPDSATPGRTTSGSARKVSVLSRPSPVVCSGVPKVGIASRVAAFALVALAGEEEGAASSALAELS